ncbi:MAG: type II and III secretion system protein, partial [Marinobacterium sp.]|nr:type II and III secretion system protein [Marinobacterium sp.]
LSVRPVIDNDTVRLEISTTAGSLSGDSTAADVITNNRSITTTVTAKDGELVYLGGLLQEDKKSNTTGVPVLQKVPFFGGLFGRDDDRLSKTKLSVFLKPTIL